MPSESHRLCGAIWVYGPFISPTKGSYAVCTKKNNEASYITHPPRDLISLNLRGGFAFSLQSLLLSICCSIYSTVTKGFFKSPFAWASLRPYTKSHAAHSLEKQKETEALKAGWPCSPSEQCTAKTRACLAHNQKDLMMGQEKLSSDTNPSPRSKFALKYAAQTNKNSCGLVKYCCSHCGSSSINQWAKTPLGYTRCEDTPRQLPHHRQHIHCSQLF